MTTAVATPKSDGAVKVISKSTSEVSYDITVSWDGLSLSQREKIERLGQRIDRIEGAHAPLNCLRSLDEQWGYFYYLIVTKRYCLSSLSDNSAIKACINRDGCLKSVKALEKKQKLTP